MDKIYRAILLDVESKKIEIIKETLFYTEAHYETLQKDYLYPEKEAYVQISSNKGLTWEYYYASEYINGKPAWAYHQDIYHNHLVNKEL